ncbi:alpha/beta fold hydrolase [Yunchengibacter salinarum]|uniref:alpha/beta fold hydrolase n=1 Tax=Yunchengibacter salinarum TaxID=3133399 RepID=UPI0035B5D22B
MVALTDLLTRARALRRVEPDGGGFDGFRAADGARLRFASFAAGNSDGAGRGTVVFVPGRTEFIEKYFEDMHLFQAFGFSVAALDLRGQGLSHREDPDRDRHVIRDFTRHVSDLASFLADDGPLSDLPRPLILVGHSAGSHVVLRTLHDHPGIAERAVTIAPMVAINGGPMPGALMRLMAGLMTGLGMGRSWLPGHGPYREGVWGWRKQLTHDDGRFADEDWFIANRDRRLAVGGVTWHWLKAALASCHVLAAPGYGEAIQTPVLMVLAGQDRIVSNAAATALAGRMPHARRIMLDGAKHEILRETDAIRLSLWRELVAFLDLDPTGARLSSAPDAAEPAP